MAVSVADMRTFAPELATVTDALVDVWLDMASTFVSADVIDDAADHDRAVKLWVAHKLTLTHILPSAAGGSITKDKVHETETMFSAEKSAAGDSSDLGRTTYGRAFRMLAGRYVQGLGLVVP